MNEQDVEVRLLHLRSNHRSDIVDEMLGAKGILFRLANTEQRNVPSMGDFLTYSKG